MPSDPDKPKRWRPRWSVRGLLVAVTLICAYLACWIPTKTLGHRDLAMVEYGRYEYYDGLILARAPLLLVSKDPNTGGSRRRYYFWFFGYVAYLYERWEYTGSRGINFLDEMTEEELMKELEEMTEQELELMKEWEEMTEQELELMKDLEESTGELAAPHY